MTGPQQPQKAERKWSRVWSVLLVLLVVAALVLPFVIKPLNGGPAISTAVELRKMSAGIEAFQKYFSVTHVPSRIKLCKYACQYDTANQLDQDSLSWLNQVWPKLHWSVPGEQQGQVMYFRIDWDGLKDPGPDRLVLNEGDRPPPAPAPVILEGDQCLVFFLDGIPESERGASGGQGFSVDPQNPAAPKGDRLSPFYEFKSTRLVKLHGNAFYSYLDHFGRQPYAYFSSYGKRNGYNKYFSSLGNSDCSRLGVWPYAHSLGQSPQYIHPDDFQIISAGADEQFGPGSVLPKGRIWSPAKAKEIDATGRDDLSNFHKLLLGKPAD